MNKKNSPHIGNNIKSRLNKPLEHIDITSFETGTVANKRLTHIHDLHNGTRPFVGRRRGGRGMSFFL